MKTKSIIPILLIIFIIIACAPATQPITTKTPLALSTTDAFTPTFLPTNTPSPTLTEIPVPTYTPAIPNTVYKIRTWSANDADLLIKQIASNLNAIQNEPQFQGVYGWEYYMEQYQYLAFAEEEALFRFPNAPQSEKWQWDICYNLAFSYQYGDSADAPELDCYSKLIENGLNSGETTLAYLSNWLESHEPRFPFAITSYSPPQGFASANVIILENNAVIWLLEQSGKFYAVGLVSSMFYFREAWTEFEQFDVTGDNFPELILDVSISNCCGSVSRFYVYEVSSGTPKLLSFKNFSGNVTHTTSDYEGFITPLEAKSGHIGLIFNGHYGYDPLFQQCNVREYNKYYWDGYQFKLAETWFGIDEPNERDDKEFCQFVIDTVKDAGEVEIAVRTIGDIQAGDPDVSREQILYRLGEYQARIGNTDKAKEYFETTIYLQPTDKSSTKWVRDAQIFLDNLNEKYSYYKVCSRIAECNIHEAFQQLVFETQLNSFTSITTFLKNSGVSIRSSGFKNFDNNNSIEQWLVIQHPNQSKREFWILVRDSENVYAVYVAEVPTDRPTLKEFLGSNEYVLSTSEGDSLFLLNNISTIKQPYVMAHRLLKNTDPLVGDDYLELYLVDESLDNITSKLFSGTDPVLIQQELTQLMQANTFDCKQSHLCDEVLYLLGVTRELIGDNKGAVESYVQLWKEYPDSFYTIMARSKLSTP